MDEKGTGGEEGTSNVKLANDKSTLISSPPFRPPPLVPFSSLSPYGKSP
jgi:hypothetical protein